MTALARLRGAVDAARRAARAGRRWLAPIRWLEPLETPYRERSWDKGIVRERPARSELFGRVRCSEEREAMLRFLDRIYGELGGTVVDIGAGVSYLKRLNGRLARGTRVLSQDAVCYEGVDVVCDAAELSAHIAAGSADAATCFEVLEHLHDPAAALREIFAVLKPGGRLYGTVPFRYPIHGWKNGEGRLDYWRFTEHGLRLMLERQFEEVRIFYSGRLREEPVAYAFVARKGAR